MKTKERFDTFKIDASVEKNAAGFLRIPVLATRTGIFKYRDATGREFNELRPPDEVFDQSSIESLRSAPVTLRHPPDMVNPQNAAQYIKGYLIDDVKKEGDKIASVAIITHEDAISAILDDGMREVSCGYSAEIDDTPGEFEGQKYDSIQRNIRYNHLAIVDKGRAGPEVKLRIDAAEAVMDIGLNPNPKEGSKMKVKIGGKEFEASDELASAITQLVTDHESALTGAKSKLDSSQGRVDGLVEEVKQLKTSKKPEIEPSQVREAVKARVKLEKTASQVLSKEAIEKMDSLSDLELRKAIVKADQASAELDGKSEDYINGRFDITVEKLAAKAKTETEIGEDLIGTRNDGTLSLSEKARAKSMEASQNAWKSKQEKEGA